MIKSELSKDGKRELALALHLWKSFKCQGKINIEIYKQTIELANYIGVKEEFEELDKELLVPFEIKFKE